MATVFLPQVLIVLRQRPAAADLDRGGGEYPPGGRRHRLGLTGFIQMAIGAAAAQLSVTHRAARPGAMPMLVPMLLFGIATGGRGFSLVRRLTSHGCRTFS